MPELWIALSTHRALVLKSFLLAQKWVCSLSLYSCLLPLLTLTISRDREIDGACKFLLSFCLSTNHFLETGGKKLSVNNNDAFDL